jgi:hypothetical protein
MVALLLIGVEAVTLQTTIGGIPLFVPLLGGLVTAALVISIFLLTRPRAAGVSEAEGRRRRYIMVSGSARFPFLVAVKPSADEQSAPRRHRPKRRGPRGQQGKARPAPRSSR